ncbi:MAG: LuxR C-terminal-related transcriptional regulator [Legionella sp.]|nr:LuxR C-terminal-related transcriptional regulator [Legionella sp.]
MFEETTDLLNMPGVHIPINALKALISPPKNHVIFVKNNQHLYQYSNLLFCKLMGFQKGASLKNLTDYDLCRNKFKVKTYLAHDEEVLDTHRTIAVSEEILPKNNTSLITQLSGFIHPLFDEKFSTVGVLGIMSLHHQVLNLDLDSALKLSPQEIDQLLIKRTYRITFQNRLISLSKREIQCILELVKGAHAGEIADVLKLKQSTIEFYLKNIKNKLGENKKNNLIKTIFNHQLIEQIIL